MRSPGPQPRAGSWASSIPRRADECKRPSQLIATDPCPPAATRLIGGTGEWRVRIGDESGSSTRSRRSGALALVLSVGHRREVYQRHSNWSCEDCVSRCIRGAWDPLHTRYRRDVDCCPRGRNRRDAAESRQEVGDESDRAQAHGNRQPRHVRAVPPLERPDRWKGGRRCPGPAAHRARPQDRRGADHPVGYFLHDGSYVVAGSFDGGTPTRSGSATSPMPTRHGSGCATPTSR